MERGRAQEHLLKKKIQAMLRGRLICPAHRLTRRSRSRGPRPTVQSVPVESSGTDQHKKSLRPDANISVLLLLKIPGSFAGDVAGASGTELTGAVCDGVSTGCLSGIFTVRTCYLVPAWFSCTPYPYLFAGSQLPHPQSPPFPGREGPSAEMN